MTENKRFTHRKWYNERQLFDGEEPFAIVDTYIQSDKICDKLNEIAEKNVQLKKENELLKQDLEHCANQFKEEDGKNVLLGLK